MKFIQYIECFRLSEGDCSNRFSFNGVKRDFAERVNENIKRRKAFVARQTFDETKINLLRDNGDFECAENVIKKNI